MENHIKNTNMSDSEGGGSLNPNTTKFIISKTNKCHVNLK